jgi:hypothetical protein
LDSDPKILILDLRNNGRTQRIRCRNGGWEKGRLAIGAFPERAMAASGAWIAEDTYEAQLCFYETPFIAKLRLRFAGEQLLCDFEYNVSFGPTRQPQLVGQAM